MRYPILKTHIEMAINELSSKIQSYKENVKEINLGEDYVLKHASNDFTQIAKAFYQLMSLNDKALKYFDEYCDCGSGLVPFNTDENDVTVCKECIN